MESNKARFFTLEERIEIHALLQTGLSIPQVAELLKRSIGGVSREIRRNGTKLDYCPHKAHERALKMRDHVNPKRFTREDRVSIEEGLKLRLSYAQIGRRINRRSTSIGYEVNRNGGRDAYDWKTAESMAYVDRKPKKDPIEKRPIINIHYLNKKIENIEFQLEIITQNLEEVLNGKNN